MMPTTDSSTPTRWGDNESFAAPDALHPPDLCNVITSLMARYNLTFKGLNVSKQRYNSHSIC